MKIYKGIKTLEVLEGADNYNRWIADRIKKYIKSPALEIGAGIGNISAHFVQKDYLVLSDVDGNLVDYLRNKFKSNKNVSVETLDIGETLTKVSFKFKTIYSVNVLEHIKDDLGALLNMNALLEKGGRVIVLVPAKKYAFKKLDKRLGHYRRYEKEELRVKLATAGFEIEELEYFNIVGLLSWIVRDLFSSKSSHLKPGQVKLFDAIVPFLERIEPRHGLPVGISLIAVGRKR